MFEQIVSIIWVYMILLYLAFLLMTANFLDYTYLKYSFQYFPIIIYDDLYQYYSIYSCFVYRQSLRKKNIAGLIFVSWYPTIYWIINAAVVIFAFPKALKRKKGGYATWSSPDRGNIQR